MKYYVLTFHFLKNDGSYGNMYGKPMIFNTREDAVEYGRQLVDYTRTDFNVNETTVTTYIPKKKVG